MHRSYASAPPKGKKPQHGSGQSTLETSWVSAASLLSRRRPSSPLPRDLRLRRPDARIARDSARERSCDPDRARRRTRRRPARRKHPLSVFQEPECPEDGCRATIRAPHRRPSAPRSRARAEIRDGCEATTACPKPAPPDGAGRLRLRSQPYARTWNERGLASRLVKGGNGTFDA